jgi:3-isopropylmalate/(R)-2-methylmalate dehydratase small subunit
MNGMRSRMLSGRVWKFGDDINTDVIQPTPYMYLPAREQARHVFEANRPGWVDAVTPGDIIVAGRNFGMGSSRPAPLALRELGLGCLIADSINALFFRNCVSFGLLAVECPGVFAAFAEGDGAEIEIDRLQVRNARTCVTLPLRPIPEQLVALMCSGGIFPLLEAEGLVGPASAGQGAGNAAATD